MGKGGEKWGSWGKRLAFRGIDALDADDSR